MLNSKMLIIIVILILNIGGGYVLHENRSMIDSMKVEIDRLSGEVSYDKARYENRAIVLGGAITETLKDGIVLDIYFFGGNTFKDPQGEKRILVSDSTVLRERTVIEVSDNYFLDNEKDIDFDDIAVGSTVEVEVMASDVFPEFIIAKKMVVLKY